MFPSQIKLNTFFPIDEKVTFFQQTCEKQCQSSQMGFSLNSMHIFGKEEPGNEKWLNLQPPTTQYKSTMKFDEIKIFNFLFYNISKPQSVA